MSFYPFCVFAAGFGEGRKVGWITRVGTASLHVKIGQSGDFCGGKVPMAPP